jgi:hypothetical protein
MMSSAGRVAWLERAVRRALEYRSADGEAWPVTRAFPGSFGVVEGHQAAQMGAGRGQRVQPGGHDRVRHPPAAVAGGHVDVLGAGMEEAGEGESVGCVVVLGGPLVGDVVDVEAFPRPSGEPLVAAGMELRLVFDTYRARDREWQVGVGTNEAGKPARTARSRFGAT